MARCKNCKKECRSEYHNGLHLIDTPGGVHGGTFSLDCIECGCRNPFPDYQTLGEYKGRIWNDDRTT